MSVPDPNLPPALNLVATTFSGSNPSTVNLSVNGLSGTRVVNPSASTGFSFSATSDPADVAPGAFYASKAVAVLPDNSQLNLTLTIRWGCNSAPGGGPGWTTVGYAAGEFASTGVNLVGVRNISGFPVQLSLTRGSASAPATVSLDNNQSSSALNGGLFLNQAWTAAPDPPNLFDSRPQTCDDVAAAPGATLPPDIQLQLTLECGSN